MSQENVFCTCISGLYKFDALFHCFPRPAGDTAVVKCLRTKIVIHLQLSLFLNPFAEGRPETIFEGSIVSEVDLRLRSGQLRKRQGGDGHDEVDQSTLQTGCHLVPLSLPIITRWLISKRAPANDPVWEKCGTDVAVKLQSSLNEEVHSLSNEIGTDGGT